MPQYRYAAKPQPSSIVIGGHSFFNGTFSIPDQSFRMDQIACAMLDIAKSERWVYSISGGTLLGDGAATAGYPTILQKVTRPVLSAPYVGRGGVYLYCWGINDIGNYIPSSDFGTKTVYATVRNAFKHGLRTVISRARSGTVWECGGTDAETQWAFGAGMASSTINTQNSGTGYRAASATTNATATFTIPADFPGGTLAFGFVGSAGAFGGTATVGGTFSQSGAASIVTSSLMPAGGGNHGHYLRRFTGLPATDAGKTVIFTVTAVDATGFFIVDYAQMEATYNIPLVVVCNIPRALNNSAYSSYAGSYWANASNLGASGDTDVADFNTAIGEVVAEFDGNVQVTDLDTVIGKSATAYGTDGIHPNASVTPACAAAIYGTIQNAPTAWSSVTPDNRTPGVQRLPRSSQQWYMPEINGMVSTTLTLVTGQYYALPVIITEPTERWDGLAFEVTTAATGTGGTVRLGIYDDVNWQCYPFALLTDLGTVAVTAGVKTVLSPTLDWPFDPGLFWMVLNMEAQGGTAAGALRAFTGQVPLLPSSTTAAAPAIGTFTGNTCWRGTGLAAGGLPKTFPTTAALLATAAPVMMFRKK